MENRVAGSAAELQIQSDADFASDPAQVTFNSENTSNANGFDLAFSVFAIIIYYCVV